MKKILTLKFLRITALIVVLAGAVTSLDLMIQAGRNNDSRLLILLFAGWVLSPFVAFIVAEVISRRWSVGTRITFYWLMLFIAPISVLSYSGAFNTPQTKNAFVFLIVPLISWVLMVIVITISVFLSRKKSE